MCKRCFSVSSFSISNAISGKCPHNFSASSTSFLTSVLGFRICCSSFGCPGAWDAIPAHRSRCTNRFIFKQRLTYTNNEEHRLSTLLGDLIHTSRLYLPCAQECIPRVPDQSRTQETTGIDSRERRAQHFADLRGAAAWRCGRVQERGVQIPSACPGTKRKSTGRNSRSRTSGIKPNLSV